MATNQAGSKRWTHFHSALQLAIQRASHKWTYEDFAECFALWCNEHPDGSSAVFGQISRHMESLISDNCEEVFAEYNLKENIDSLHAVVTDARARKQNGQTSGEDVWRENIEPRAAVRARTIPLLQAEAERLRATLLEMEKENAQLQNQLQSNTQRLDEADRATAELLDILDQVYEKWKQVPLEEIETWTVQSVESAAPALR